MDQWLLRQTRHLPSKSEKERILTFISFLVWNIWKARCAFVYEHKPLSPSYTISTTIKLVTEFLDATNHSLVNLIHDTYESEPHPAWSAPPVEHVKVNCDASWLAPNSAGLGVVIRDHTDSFLGGSATQAICSSVEIAESEALLSGVNLAASLNLKKVKFESDAREVITNLKNPRARSWRLFLIIDQIRKRCSMFDYCTWGLGLGSP
ncbi:uncharacterized protein LOC133725692 [Rosa rugosa]|uniref:uncharacterized protein LOC133725692 n=1 Tax=Rosa rugosa TaxID=74645 RepID=UPI002B41152A|nr:uncharacterized protein LOC133725692 [Rosa rugosa]